MGSAAATLALVAIIGGLVNALLGSITNEDDLVCERNIAWTKEGLNALSHLPNSQVFTIFDGRYQGRHKL